MIEVNINKTVPVAVSFELKAFTETLIRLKGIEDGEFSFTFVDSDQIVAINRQYLNRTYVTDIISFNLAEANEPIMGDVYICVDKAAENAAEFASSFESEIQLLIVHGLLHLLDYEDYTDEDRAAMFKEQDRLLELVTSC